MTTIYHIKIDDDGVHKAISKTVIPELPADTSTIDAVMYAHKNGIQPTPIEQPEKTEKTAL